MPGIQQFRRTRRRRERWRHISIACSPVGSISGTTEKSHRSSLAGMAEIIRRSWRRGCKHPSQFRAPQPPGIYARTVHRGRSGKLEKVEVAGGPSCARGNDAGARPGAEHAARLDVPAVCRLRVGRRLSKTILGRCWVPHDRLAAARRNGTGMASGAMFLRDPFRTRINTGSKLA